LEDQADVSETPSRIRHDASNSDGNDDDDDDSFGDDIVASEYFLTAGSMNPIFTVEDPPIDATMKEISIHPTQATSRNSIRLSITSNPEKNKDVLRESSEAMTVPRASSPLPSLDAILSPDHSDPLDGSSEEIIFYRSQGLSDIGEESQELFHGSLLLDPTVATDNGKDGVTVEESETPMAEVTRTITDLEVPAPTT
jgi:hypothetical protein